MVTWRCPRCQEQTSSLLGELAEGLRCELCGHRIDSADALCVVCDAPNPLRRRDSLHLWCTKCGNTQTPWIRAMA
jgi:ribosomal protein S27E